MRKVYGIFLLLIGSLLMGVTGNENLIVFFLIRCIGGMCFFFAIRNLINRSNPISELMPDNQGEYSVLWLTDRDSDINDFKGIFNSASKVTIMRNMSSTNKKYRALDLEKGPLLIIFDNNGVVLRTPNISVALEFLENKYKIS